MHKALSADIFVYLDTVQFSKNGVQNRNQIKTAQGANWLTLPVRHELGRTIMETKIADAARSRGKHWKTLCANYARTPGFARWKDELQSLFLDQPTDSLCDLAIASTEWMLSKLVGRGAGGRRIRASEIVSARGEASELVASICQAMEAASYLTGTGALAYLDAGDFSAIGCEVLVQEWRPFEYPQAHPRAGFVADLSALDLLLNCPDTAAQLIRSAGNWRALRNPA